MFQRLKNFFSKEKSPTAKELQENIKQNEQTKQQNDEIFRKTQTELKLQLQEKTKKQQEIQNIQFFLNALAEFINDKEQGEKREEFLSCIGFPFGRQLLVNEPFNGNIRVCIATFYDEFLDTNKERISNTSDLMTTFVEKIHGNPVRRFIPLLSSKIFQKTTNNQVREMAMYYARHQKSIMETVALYANKQLLANLKERQAVFQLGNSMLLEDTRKTVLNVSKIVQYQVKIRELIRETP